MVGTGSYGLGWFRLVVGGCGGSGDDWGGGGGVTGTKLVEKVGEEAGEWTAAEISDR